MTESDTEIEFNIIGREESVDNINPNNNCSEEMDQYYNAQGDYLDVQDEGQDMSCRDQACSPMYGACGRADRGHHSKTRSITLKPDTYDGLEDWDQYISHFVNCADLGGWTERERALTLAACLKGQARVFYASLPAHEKCDYFSLTRKLEQRFGSARQQTRWLSRLQSRRRLPNEPIASYGDDLRLMAQKAYPSMDRNAQEMLALQQFYKALTLEMRCRLMDRDVKSVSEAVDVVERYEEVLGNDGVERRRNITRSVETVKNQISESTNGQDSICKTLKEIVERLKRVENLDRISSLDVQGHVSFVFLLIISLENAQRIKETKDRGRIMKNNLGNDKPSFQ